MKIQNFNNDVKQWADECVRLLKQSIIQQGIVSKRNYKNNTDLKLKDSIYSKITYTNGVASKVGFGFKKHGIFVHYGLAGQGGKVHVSERKWWSNVMELQYDKLSIIATDFGAEMVADKLTAQFNFNDLINNL